MVYTLLKINTTTTTTIYDLEFWGQPDQATASDFFLPQNINNEEIYLYWFIRGDQNFQTSLSPEVDPIFHGHSRHVDGGWIPCAQNKIVIC